MGTDHIWNVNRKRRLSPFFSLVEKVPSAVASEFLIANEKQLGANSGQLYCFVESIIDHSVALGVKPEMLIEVAPAGYKLFLSKRFTSR